MNNSIGSITAAYLVYKQKDTLYKCKVTEVSSNQTEKRVDECVLAQGQKSRQESFFIAPHI